MNIEKINPNIKYVYHYTLKENVEKILEDQAIISKDQYVFFTKSLNDSIIAFEREMMQENKLYIDIDGILRRRKKCNKDDYCILKIPYKNDNKFYKFNFENQSKESIYTISISHKGSYYFKKAEVLEFPKNKKSNVLNKTAVAAAIISGIVLFPYNNTYAASWLDNNNYDTSWYNDSMGKYQLETAKQMAGLAYLVNNENITFEEKYIEITKDIDLTENTWQTIKDIFDGTICGGHRIILNCLDGKLIENNNKFNNWINYSYEVLIDDNLKKINVEAPYTVQKLKEVIGINSTVFFNNEILSDNIYLQELNLTEKDRLEVFSGRYIYVENVAGVKMPFYTESGNSIDNVKQKYSEKTNIPQDKIIIKYNEKELDDERTLADYNIQKYETINAYIKINITTNVDEGEGTILSSHDTAIEGEEIIITLKPETEYELSKIFVNGIEKTSEVQNNELKIQCNDEDINVKVSYKLKEKAEENLETDIELNDDETSINNPQTGDNIFTYLFTLISSVIVLGISTYKKIKNKN